MTHQPTCKWQRTTSAECAYRNTHHYCPHPEHACTCPPWVTRAETCFVCGSPKKATDEGIRWLAQVIDEARSTLARELIEAVENCNPQLTFGSANGSMMKKCTLSVLRAKCEELGVRLTA